MCNLFTKNYLTFARFCSIFSSVTALQNPVWTVTKRVPAGALFTINGGIMIKQNPFLSFDQQLNKLINEKNLVVKDRAFANKMLKQIGYFSLISGYKDLYINPTTRKYKDNTTFEEIVALYTFDENLRELFLKYLLKIEQNMKSLLSYYFTKKYGENQIHYLSVNSYTSIPKHGRGVKKMVNMLNNIAITSNGYDYIMYHRNTYNNVPLWVLVKVLTFGNISHMYQYIPQSLQAKISKDFGGVNENDLMRFFRVLTKFRNVCAHGERLYSYRLRKEDIPDMDIHLKLNITKKGKQYVFGKKDLFSVVIAFRYLLNKSDFLLFKRRLGTIIDKFINHTNNVSKNDLFDKMGFPENWKKISSFKI